MVMPIQVHANDLRDALTTRMPDLMALYRDLHAHPELSMQEVRTAKKLAAQMRSLGFAVTEGVGGTGVVAEMRNGSGPIVMLRADMDGLPVTEETGLPFASKVRVTSSSGVESGVMHACGHDTHMTAWIAAAELLAARKDQWSGTLLMIAEPGEEVGLGAKAMLDDGLYTRFPKPDYALAFHDAAQYPAGMIGYSTEYAYANVDSVDILVRGQGGHGAYPHTTKDPIVLASAIVMKLQTLVSREVNPIEPAVVTVGSFHAGTKHNVIPAEAKLQLTVRSYDAETRKLLLDGIARIARGEAVAAGLPEDRMPVVTVLEGSTPAAANTPDFAQEMARLFTARFGAERVKQVPPVMAGEDFGRYRLADPDHIRSLIFWVGGVPQDKYYAAQIGGASLPSLHSALWAPDAEKVVGTAAEALAAAALELMPVGDVAE
nr:amidohydrolase [Croceicoccus estronivorus]